MDSIKNITVMQLDETFDRCSDKPHLYVTYTSKPPAKLLEHIQRGNGPRWIHGRVVSLLPELVPSYKTTRSATVARRRVKNLTASLKERGYAVNQDSYVYTVYVVDLDIENPTKLLNVGRLKRAVYVGQTSKSPEMRYLQHKKKSALDKSLASRVVLQRGVGLRHELMPKKQVFTKAAALKLEEDVSKELDKRGFRVFGDGMTRARTKARKSLNS